MAEFSTIKQQITIGQLLDMIGVTGLKPSKAKVKGVEVDVLRGHCPVCKDGDNRVFVVYPSTNSYYCWSEKKGGDVLTLASRFWRVPIDEAGRRIASQFGLSAPRKEARDDNGFDAEAFQKALNPEAPELAGCGVSVETLRHYGGGWCTKPSLKSRLAFPICDITGAFRHFLGIDLETGDISYPKVKDFLVPFFFGVDKLDSGTLHVVYHPLDLLRAVDNNIENVLALLTPITPDVLTSLHSLMLTKGLHTVEFH